MGVGGGRGQVQPASPKGEKIPCVSERRQNSLLRPAEQETAGSLIKFAAAAKHR